jgi:acetyl-CoA synthase
MSKIIVAAAVRGAYALVERAENDWATVEQRLGVSTPIGFPNTAYFLPVIYGMTGLKVEYLSDVPAILKRCRTLLPAPIVEDEILMSLQPALDAGMAALFAEEVIEAVRYLENPDLYTGTEDPTPDHPWLGAADDVILRKRGVEFVDGSAPGFAAILGAAPTKEIAARIAAELQERNLYTFMSAEAEGQRLSQQLVSAGVQTGWPTRLIPFGPDASSTVFAVGFAVRGRRTW